jgi:hypothetical protein
MTYLETKHLVEQVKCHAADFGDMSAVVGFRQTANDHVSVAYGLHLNSLKANHTCFEAGQIFEQSF